MAYSACTHTMPSTTTPLPRRRLWPASSIPKQVSGCPPCRAMGEHHHLPAFTNLRSGVGGVRTGLREEQFTARRAAACVCPANSEGC
jgi:hypothetical protein